MVDSMYATLESLLHDINIMSGTDEGMTNCTLIEQSLSNKSIEFDRYTVNVDSMSLTHDTEYQINEFPLLITNNQSVYIANRQRKPGVLDIINDESMKEINIWDGDRWNIIIPRKPQTICNAGTLRSKHSGYYYTTWSFGSIVVGSFIAIILAVVNNVLDDNITPWLYSIPIAFCANSIGVVVVSQIMMSYNDVSNIHNQKCTLVSTNTVRRVNMLNWRHHIYPLILVLGIGYLLSSKGITQSVNPSLLALTSYSIIVLMVFIWTIVPAKNFEGQSLRGIGKYKYVYDLSKVSNIAMFAIITLVSCFALSFSITPR